MSWPTGAGPTLLTGPAGTLEARLAAPEGAPRALAVICHPHPLFGGSMDNKVVTTLERVFLARDCATVRFNFRGVGGSAGVHDDAQGEVDDLRAVVQQAQDWLPGLPLWLAGFSFGSYIAAARAVEGGVAGLVTVAPPVSRWGYAGLGPVPCPWWVVQGDADDVVDPQAVFDYVEVRPEAPTLLRLDGAGHFFHGRLIELRDRLLAALPELLDA
ncbi:MAG: alpha/beta hydrolase [Xanthomonadales bacterium]|nr:alpha/beta hydrolase [Xanthomonadales bacterium]